MRFTNLCCGLLQKSQTEPKNSICMDDTILNVDKMKQKFPKMDCIYAVPGVYTDAVSKIDTLLQRKKQAAGSWKRKPRKLNKKRVNLDIYLSGGDKIRTYIKIIHIDNLSRLNVSRQTAYFGIRSRTRR